MKMIYNVLVPEEAIARMDSLLNTFRVSLNDRDRSKVFEIHDARLVNYTIACTAEVHKAITDYLYNV